MVVCPWRCASALQESDLEAAHPLSRLGQGLTSLCGRGGVLGLDGITAS